VDATFFNLTSMYLEVRFFCFIPSASARLYRVVARRPTRARL